MAQNPNMLAPNIPGQLQKAILKLLLTFDRFFDRFLVPSWRQNRAQDRPRRPQDAPKTATWPQLAENSRDLAKNCRDLAKNKAKNKDITHDCKRTPDIKAECCQTSSKPQSARTPKTWGGGTSLKGVLNKIITKSLIN